MPVLGNRRLPSGQTLVDANISEARFGREHLVEIAANELERRVRNVLVVVPPLGERLSRIVGSLGGSGHVVAFPRVGLEILYLVLHEWEVDLAWVQDSMG